MSIPDAAAQLVNHPKAHATVITTNPSGTPQVTLVWAEVADGVLSFNTAAGRQKERNIRRNSHVAVSVQDPENPRQYAVFEGTATITEEGSDEQIDRLAKKYLGLDSYPQRSTSEQRVRVNIEVERITGMGPWVG
ncbi:MAG: PPOX class F420-dependent oxidoreductase [Dehalococcoidia bacterium]